MLKEKKIYKKSQKETGENSKKQAKFSNSKQRAAGQSYVTSKTTGSQGAKASAKKSGGKQDKKAAKEKRIKDAIKFRKTS